VAEAAHLRIGELSRRVGVPPELLRAWEQRYGLLRPVRSAGGFRLYTAADENRVRSMRRHLDAGVSAAQAARLALREPSAGAGDAPLTSELADALDRLDESAAHDALDRLLARFTLQTVLRDVLLPYLHELGERWERGDASVAQEHFASNLLRGRLLGLGRGWGRSAGPRAVLACAPGELHDLPLIIFGLALAARGWSITYLGADTPIATIHEALADVEPRLVVVSAAATERLRAVQRDVGDLALHVPIALAGSGATDRLARTTGAMLLQGDPVTAAERLADDSR
jgi:MerR family transcriptional regulator, light-induced transcriptional regulator